MSLVSLHGPTGAFELKKFYFILCLTCYDHWQNTKKNGESFINTVQAELSIKTKKFFYTVGHTVKQLFMI